MIVHAHRSYVGDEQNIHREKDFPSSYTLYVDIVFGEGDFRDFQKNIIDEGVARIYDILEHDDMMYDDVITAFEEEVLTMNAALQDLAHQTQSAHVCDIRGIISLTRHTNLISAVIGNVSMVLIRDGRIGYSMQNDPKQDAQQNDQMVTHISLFSDIIEGEIERGDTIVVLGTHIDSIFDREEHNDLAVHVDTQQPEEVLESYDKALSAVVSPEMIAFLVVYAYPTVRAMKKRSVKVPSFAKNISMPGFTHSIGGYIKQSYTIFCERIAKKLEQKQFIVGLIVVGVFICFVLRSIIQGWIKNTGSQSIAIDGSVTAALSIDDIKKEIALFQKLDPTSEEKGVKYNAIIKELQRIQDEGKRSHDVQQLKKVLDAEYYQGFNIITFDSLQDQRIYDFSSMEKASLEQPIQIFSYKGLHVAGKRGAILAAISQDVRGTVVRSALDDDFTTCSMNLIRSGLYCVTSKDTLYHLSKIGTEQLAGENVIFPKSIAGIATFGNANMYLLTNDPTYTKDKTYIVKFTSSLGSLNTFGVYTPLAVQGSLGDEVFAQGLQTLAIDGSFLTRSPAKKSLIQLFRNPADKVLSVREVPLKGGTTIGKGFSEQVKVMTTPSTRYVYLYDKTNKELSVYISAPAKNSDSFSSSYSLEYVMRVDFSRIGDVPRDVIVDEGDGKQTAYVLLSDGIAKIPLTDLLDGLKKTRQAFLEAR